MTPRRSLSAGLLAGLLTLCSSHFSGCALAPKVETPGAGTEAKAWDVDNPPGPSSTVAIDVGEGTWMSVDVRPDGKELVFDLLGDLYTLPIEGGEAKAITSDIAWQRQPRYSPDGKTIAYVSDQGGGDNIWLIDAEGRHPRAVTKEPLTLLTQPAWSPEGGFLVARKQIRNHTPIGGGELWLYSTAGGDGLQLTELPRGSKGVVEPALSPDGRYVYFAKDTTTGFAFEASKDPNGRIYFIQRLDRKTGEIQDFVDGSGGSFHPTPAPDGKTLAFVRRVRGKSVIHLKDLGSGEEWPVYDGLDRDLQETLSTQGVYPGMSWMPESRELVFWAGGKLRRLDVASGAVTVIPFHARRTKKLIQPLRFPVEVAPKSFQPKMLRWAEVSPDGSRVVFQALGYLWIRDFPKGTPRRLTRQTDHWELYPSFSRDGRQIVYTTWNDDTLGSVRVVSAEGGEGRVVVGRPGHYVAPVFTPDGRQVVYQKIRGGYIRTPTWSSEPGVYRASLPGGEPARVTKDGSSPHFGADGDRVFLTRWDDEGRLQLFSIGLDGKDERVHFAIANGNELKVSPDGRWVAFTEPYNAYLLPFAATGQSVEVGPGMTALPLRKVSRDAGEYLHWSGDSRQLRWSLGPELFSQDLQGAFSFVPGAPEKLPEPPEKGVSLTFEVPSDAPTGQVALVGGRVVTMRGDEVIEDGTVITEGNRIRAVGPRSQVPVPPDAHVVDARGSTVVPGLIDVHWHGTFGTDGIVPQRNWTTYSTLAYGVTTLHDPSNETETVFAAAEMARAGSITAPRIFSTGTILYGNDLAILAKIDSLDDARSHLRRMKAVGAFSVKSYFQPRRDQRQQILAAARELGMMVVPEGGALFEQDLGMIVDGHTGIEHSIPVAPIYDDVRQLWKATPVGYTPTLIVAFGSPWGETYWYDKTRVWEDSRLLAFVPREIVDERSRRRITVPEEEYTHVRNARVATELSRLGVGVQVGAHGQREGLGAHWEMWMLCQGGSTPLEALRAATLAGARYLGLDRDLGSIEPGKLADLVVIRGDVLSDIRKSADIGEVILNGRVYDSLTLDQLYPDAHRREPFFFQKQQPAFSLP